MAEIKSILESPYKLQKQQDWKIPDVAAEEKHIGLNSKDTKGKIFTAYQWLVEMYFKMRHDAKKEIADLSQKNILLDKEVKAQKDHVNRLIQERDFTTKNVPAPKEGIPGWVIGMMIAAAAILAGVIGVNVLG
jgi:uncharacterized protein (DUF2344 family)